MTDVSPSDKGIALSFRPSASWLTFVVSAIAFIFSVGVMYNKMSVIEEQTKANHDATLSLQVQMAEFGAMGERLKMAIERSERFGQVIETMHDRQIEVMGDLRYLKERVGVPQNVVNPANH